MAQITLRDLSIRFRGPLLLDDVSCQIELGERIGLMGRNGSGKTTLMRMLCGQVEPDGGSISFAPETRLSLLPQDVPADLHGPVLEVITQGIDASQDHHEPQWEAERRVEQLVTRMDLPAEGRFETLSSGLKRRVLLARSLASDPSVLLLDEPTNHLDVEAILWLEDFLSRWPKTLIFVTHDRMFLRKLSTRIIEIDRGHLNDWSCDYDTFLARREQVLAAEEKQNALFDKKLAEEEVWIRQGIKARRTRNEGRVRALEKMRRERSERRGTQGKVKLAIQEGQRSGNLVAEVEDISFAYDDRSIVSDFSTTIERGDKIGIIGRNGAGKTTLLRLLLGQLAPQKGSVRLGANLQVAYFDQLRQQLNEEASVVDNVGDGYDTIQTGEGRSRHIIGYLQDFLFSPERARTQVKFLSGGERNRVLLAKHFAKPANTLVLDEPTNDLDAETLELLEERLVEYQGTVLLVSHDRAFLNNVVTSTIVFENGNVKEYFGGYDDWLRQRPQPAAEVVEPVRRRTAEPVEPIKPAVPSAERKRRLSYKEGLELQSLPGTIEQLESDIAALHEEMAQPEFYQQPGAQIAEQQSKLKELETKLATVYERWEELEQASG
ncbi:MAG: ATP-binding cassette domain-containing protein [Pirellulales bacterium]|nr:ATP-binding cassette domain-containing protein [Pirellulales bacterium]